MRIKRWLLGVYLILLCIKSYNGALTVWIIRAASALALGSNITLSGCVFVTNETWKGWPPARATQATLVALFQNR
jgi:hypothetical protein